MSDLVSIIIPFYKKKKYFKKCIRSIVSQTYKKIEVIIIYDDENKDDLNHIKLEIKKYKNFRLLVNKKNIGAGASRNLGVKKSKGKFIAFLDSDDFWSKNKIKNQLNYMKRKNIVFTHTNYFLVNEKNKILGLMKAKKILNYNDLLRSGDVGLSTVMLKKELLNKNFFPKLKTKEDYSLWLNLSKKGVEIIGIDQNLSYWRKLKDSLSSSSLQKLSDAFKVYYYFENKNIFLSFFYVIRLSSNFFIKKFNQKKNLFT